MKMVITTPQACTKNSSSHYLKEITIQSIKSQEPYKYHTKAKINTQECLPQTGGPQQKGQL